MAFVVRLTFLLLESPLAWRHHNDNVIGHGHTRGC